MRLSLDDPRFEEFTRNQRPLHLTGEGRMGWGEYMFENIREGFRHGTGALYDFTTQALLKPWEERGIVERAITPADWLPSTRREFNMISPQQAQEEYGYTTDRPVSREWLEFVTQRQGELDEMAQRFQFADVGTASRIASLVPAMAGYAADPIGFLELALTARSMTAARAMLQGQKVSRFTLAATYPIRRVDDLVGKVTQSKFLRGGAQGAFSSSIASLPELAWNMEANKEIAWKTYLSQNALAFVLGGAFGKILKGPASSKLDDFPINNKTNAASASSKTAAHFGDREDLVKSVARAQDEVNWHNGAGPENARKWKEKADAFDEDYTRIRPEKRLTPEEHALEVDVAREEVSKLRASRRSITSREKALKDRDPITLAAMDERMEQIKDANPARFEEYRKAADESPIPFMDAEARAGVLDPVEEPVIVGRPTMTEEQSIVTEMAQRFRQHYINEMTGAGLNVRQRDLIEYLKNSLEDKGFLGFTDKEVRQMLRDIDSGKGYRGPVRRDTPFPTREQAEELLEQKVRELDQLDHRLREENDKLIERNKQEMERLTQDIENQTLEYDVFINEILPEKLAGKVEWPKLKDQAIDVNKLHWVPVVRNRFNQNKLMHDLFVHPINSAYLSDPNITIRDKIKYLEERFPADMRDAIDFRKSLDIFQRARGNPLELEARFRENALAEAKLDLLREASRVKFKDWAKRGYGYFRAMLDGSFSKATKGSEVAFNLESTVKERRNAAMAVAHSIMRKHNMVEVWGNKNLTRDLWMAKDNPGYLNTIGDENIRAFVKEFTEYLEFFDEQFLRTNRAMGSTIEKRADYVFRLSHQRLNSKNVDEWVDSMMSNYLDRDALRVSHEYLFRDPEKSEESIRGFLRESAETLLGNRGDDKLDSNLVGGSLVSRESAGRQLPIKRDMRMDYDSQWGSQDPAAMILDHLNNRSENLALMEILGPDYKVVESEISLAQNLNAWEKYRLRSIVRQLTGELNTPVNVNMARATQATMQATNLRLLGLNAISQLYTDSTTTRNTLNYLGFNNAGAIGNYYKWQFNIRNLPKDHPMQIRADAVGVSLDAYNAALRYQGQDIVNLGAKGVFGLVDRLHQGFFNVTGILRVNQAGRFGTYDLVERMYSNAARWLRDGTFPEDGSFRANDLSADGKKLNDQLLFAMRRWGITEQMLRDVPFDDTGRIDFLAITDIGVRRRFNQMFEDALSMSIMIPRASDRFWGNLGFKSGTVLGSAARILGQYNSFTSAVFNQQYKKFLYGYSNDAQGRIAMMQWLGLTLAAGVMAQVTKDAAKLRYPEEGNPTVYLRPNNLIQALDAGGAMPGIFMALQGRGTDRFPIGAGFDPAIDLIEAGMGDMPFQHIMATLMDNAPGANLPFVSDVDNLLIGTFFSEQFSAMQRAQILNSERETGRIRALRP